MIRFLLFPVLAFYLTTGLAPDRWEVTRSATLEPLSQASERVFVPMGGLDRLNRYRSRERDLWIRQDLSPRGGMVMVFWGFPRGTAVFHAGRKLIILDGTDPVRIRLSGAADYLYLRIPGSESLPVGGPSLLAGSGAAAVGLDLLVACAQPEVRAVSGGVLAILLLAGLLLGLGLGKGRRFGVLFPTVALWGVCALIEGISLLGEYLPVLSPYLDGWEVPFQSLWRFLPLYLLAVTTAVLTIKRGSRIFLTLVPVTIGFALFAAAPFLGRILSFPVGSVPYRVMAVYGRLAPFGWPAALFLTALVLIVIPLMARRIRSVIPTGIIYMAAVAMVLLIRILEPEGAAREIVFLARWIAPLWYLHLLTAGLAVYSALLAWPRHRKPVPGDIRNEAEGGFDGFDYDRDDYGDPSLAGTVPPEDFLFPAPEDLPLMAAPEPASLSGTEPAEEIPPAEKRDKTESEELTEVLVRNLQKGLLEKKSLFDPQWEVALDHHSTGNRLDSVYADIFRNGKGRLSGLAQLESPLADKSAASGLVPLVLKTGLLEALREDLPLQETARHLHRMIKDSFPDGEIAVRGHILRLSAVHRGGLVEGISFGDLPVLYRNGATGRVTILRVEGPELGVDRLWDAPLRVWRLVLRDQDLLCLYSGNLSGLRHRILNEPVGDRRMIRWFKAGGEGGNCSADEALNRMLRELRGAAGDPDIAEESALTVLRTRL